MTIVRKLLSLVASVTLVVAACSLSTSSEPIPDIRVTNKLSEKILIRADLQPSSYPGNGFDADIHLDSPLWKFSIDPDSDGFLAMFPKTPAVPKNTNGIFRVMVVTGSGDVLMNRTFTASEFQEADWSLRF